MNIVVIGGGVIGEAIARNLVAAGYDVVVTEKRVERIRELEEMGFKVTVDNKMAAKYADVIILCVKPKDVESALREIAVESEGKLIISVAAAVPLSFLRKISPRSKFIRAMPNLAIIVRESFTAYCAGPDVSQEDLKVAVEILSALGKVHMVDESYMDAITALSGCAPAYLALIAEAMTYAGLNVGLEREVSLKIAAQAMIGTGKLILEGGKTPHQIRDMVTTPGGVTISGLFELEKVPIRYAFMSAVKSAVEKSREISSLISPSKSKE
ncbi:MAG: pyrroline-5-carboxylate reductase [Candidatus Bathyarchaeia archaeon]